MNWLLISCIAAGALGLILSFVLGAFWLADQADEQSQRLERYLEEDRLIREGTECPWNLER